MSAANKMNLLNKDWKLENDEHVPIMSNVNDKLDMLLKIMDCTCKIGYSCSTNRFPYSSMCGLSQITPCDNEKSCEPEDSYEDL